MEDFDEKTVSLSPPRHFSVKVDTAKTYPIDGAES